MISVTRRTVLTGFAPGALGLTAALAGCAPNAAPAPASTKGPVRFSFWNVRSFDLMEQKLIDVYRERNPNVTIEYVAAADRGVTGADAEQANGLIVRAAGGGALDIA